MTHAISSMHPDRRLIGLASPQQLRHGLATLAVSCCPAELDAATVALLDMADDGLLSVHQLQVAAAVALTRPEDQERLWAAADVAAALAAVSR